MTTVIKQGRLYGYGVEITYKKKSTDFDCTDVYDFLIVDLISSRAR